MNTQREKNVPRGGNSVSKNPVESRPDSAILYPTRGKRATWMSDYSGITRLAETGALYWINLWDHRGGLSQPPEPRDFGLSTNLRTALRSPSAARCAPRPASVADTRGRSS